MFNSDNRFPLVALGSMLILAGAAVPSAQGQNSDGPPLFPLVASDFVRTTPHGFGDRHNSWAQAMIWWQDNLYVGTTRDSLCASLAEVNFFAAGLIGQTLANTYLPYPPPDPDLSCAPLAEDLPLQAEIWRWSTNHTWTRVFQSPATLPNPGHGSPFPPLTGKFVPYETAIRGFVSNTENGVPVLYAFGVNSTLIWDRSKLPPPRILRTTDGVNWTPVPQTPGTFLHDLPFNPDHASFRSPAIYNGRMFVLSGPTFGQGSLIASADPAQGDNAWFLAEPAGMLFYELAVFNGWLYIGGFDPTNGYAVFKTQANGSPPYPLITVVPPGAGLTGLTVHASKSVVSMFVHNDRLYVGTATFPEMIRINADDTWDLVIGSPRLDPVTKQMKFPTSNLDAGFGETLNDHIWYQDDLRSTLYAGTYHATTGSRNDPVFGPLLLHNMGAHLYRSPDDWFFTPVTMNGFADPSDPLGGKFDYGVRTMKTTPHGLFLGTANDYFGTEIFRATTGEPPSLDPPGNLEVEAAQGGGALLSWLPSRGPVSYQIWRAPVLPILLRDDANFEDFNGFTGNKVPDTYVGVYQLIGTTSNTFFRDTTVVPKPACAPGFIPACNRYMYYVMAVRQNPSKQTTRQSNLVTFPLLLPSVTFAQALDYVSTLAQRHRFFAPDTQGNNERNQLLRAQADAAACQITAAIGDLNLDQNTANRVVMSPDSLDLEIIFQKLVQRLQLYLQFPTQVQSTEFCH